MRVRRAKSVYLLLVFSLSGCKTAPQRPANVPASAAHIDGVFIDCSVEESSRENRCVVYKEGSGEVQVSGLFALSGAGREAKEAELRYVAFDGTRIWLQDARSLRPVLLEEFAVTGMTTQLAAFAGSNALNCGRVARNQSPKAASECARRAFAARKPFYVSYDQKAWDSGYTVGLAGDVEGHLYFVEYWNDGWLHPPAKPVRVSDDNRIRFGPCVKPVLLEVHNGELTCTPPTE